MHFSKLIIEEKPNNYILTKDRMENCAAIIVF